VTLRLTLLGGFEARLSTGGVLSLPARKAQALLAYLAARPGYAHRRDKLAALLWGDSGDAQARDGLRHALAALRRALPATKPPILAIEGQTLVLSPAVVEVDVATFERCVAEGTPEALERAAAVYGGDLLVGFDLNEPLFEDWLIPERERLRELALEVLARLLACQSKTGASERAIQTAVRLLALDPLQEAVHRALMRLYVRQGRRGAALKQYQRCVTVLQRELGAEPEVETRQLYRDLLRQPPADAAKPTHTRPRPRAVPARIDLPGRDTLLFGRDADRARLARALDEAAHGRGQLVVVVGEAGIGKTSLLGAFAADAPSDQARVLLGRCYESTQILPFGPWVDAVRAGDVLADESLLGALDPAWRAELTRLFPEIAAAGLPPSSDNALRLFESVARLLEHLAVAQLLVLMLEDVHWADEMSLRLLAFMARRIPSRRALLIVTSRDEELADAAAARRTMHEISREPHVTRATLAPLTRQDTIDLIHSLAPGRGEPTALAQLEEQVWDVSEGNPFVAVETTRALLDGALLPESTRLPLAEGVRAMIAGRLDRLSDPARVLAAVAAVIGREFEFRLLHRVSALDEAQAAEGVEELIRRRVLHGVGERFDFIHHRLHAVVHDSLLAPQRKLLHRRVGEALEMLASGDSGRDPLALGLHFREGEVWDKAVAYLRAAGVDAMRRSAYREATHCLEQALALSQRLPETREGLEQAIDIHIDLRNALFPLGDLARMGEHLHEAEVLARTLGDRRRLAWIATFMVRQCLIMGDYDESVRFGQEALTIARTLGDRSIEVLATTFLGQTHVARGEFGAAATLLERNVALEGDLRYQRFGAVAILSVASGAYLANVLSQFGRFDEAIRQAEAAVRIAEEADHPFSLYTGLFDLGLAHLRRGDLPRATGVLERDLDLCRKWQIAVGTPIVAAALGAAYALAARADEAVPLVTVAIEEFHRRQLHNWPAFVLQCAGMTCLSAGRIDEAAIHVREALALTRRLGARGSEAHALCLAGDVASTAGAEDAEAHYREALALATELGMRPLVAHCHRGLGKLYRRTGKRQEAHEHLTTATTMYREMDMRFWIEKTKADAD
jgi:DNA-binding SARP family transcriptional activator/ABC-type cobalamin/Fe3+-siderophores transport system ATPase subunit